MTETDPERSSRRLDPELGVTWREPFLALISAAMESPAEVSLIAFRS